MWRQRYLSFVLLLWYYRHNLKLAEQYSKQPRYDFISGLFCLCILPQQQLSNIEQYFSGFILYNMLQ